MGFEKLFPRNLQEGPNRTDPKKPQYLIANRNLTGSVGKVTLVYSSSEPSRSTTVDGSEIPPQKKQPGMFNTQEIMACGLNYLSTSVLPSTGFCCPPLANQTPGLTALFCQESDGRSWGACHVAESASFQAL